MELARKIALLESLAGVWSDQEIRYSVANGLQGYPDQIGRDIDVIFDSGQLSLAVRVTQQFFLERSFSVLSYKLGWPYWIIAFRKRDGEIEAVQVDLFDHLQWAFTWVLEGAGDRSDTQIVGKFHTDPWSSVGKRVILNGLSGKFQTFRKKPWYLDISAEERASLRGNFIRMGGQDRPELRKAIEERDYEEMAKEFRSFRKLLLFRFLKSPAKWKSRFWSAWLKQYCFNINPPWHVPVIVISGRDEQMRVALLEKLKSCLEEILPFPVSIALNRNRVRWSFFSFQKVRLQIRRASALLEISLIDAASAGPELIKTIPSQQQILLDADQDSAELGLTRVLRWFKASEHCQTSCGMGANH